MYGRAFQFINSYLAVVRLSVYLLTIMDYYRIYFSLMEDLYRFSMTLCPDFLTVLCAGGGAPGGVVGEMLTETSVQGVNCCWKFNFAVNSHGWLVGLSVIIS